MTKLFHVGMISVFAALAVAQTPPPTASPADTKPAQAAPPQATPPEPFKPFSELVKDAKEITGLFRIYATDEKVYLEIRPEQFEKLYMLSLTCDSGIGERGVYAGAMCGETPVVFHRIRKNEVQLIARNTAFRAQPGTPMARAVAQSFSDSLVGNTVILSHPHPERSSVLIDLGKLLLTDVPMFSYELEMDFRVPYKLDAANSSFGRLKAYPGNVEIETVAHYAVDRLPVPPLLPPGAPPPPKVDPPNVLPDARSMFIRFHYSLSEMPDDAYRPRLMDDRVGFFFEQKQDYSDSRDGSYTPAVRYIHRWRLEKADPSAALSKPRKPIVFWLENTIPVKYRAAIRDGVLMWNKAFERIGFQDAIEVREQPENADWEAGDVRYNTIRWFAGIDASFAQGPSRANPFTGELYDADIRFSESFTRVRRQSVREETNPLSTLANPRPAHAYRPPWASNVAQQELCTLASDAIHEVAFAFDVLEERGIDPDGPEADKLVNDYLREVTAHEVGHTLGLRHNFRSSTIRSLAELQDADVTSKEGLIGSVMDYAPFNIAAKGQKQGEYSQSTIGPYDFWAIEYAYKPIAADSPEAELPELRKIASRAADPMLAYGTDEDAGGFGPPHEIDPTANRWDLGNDPLQYYTHRIRLSREVWANIETKLEQPGEGYQVMLRSFNRALRQGGMSLLSASKYIGGLEHFRDHAGDPNARLPYRPVTATKQKEALQLINENAFAPRAFQFAPSLLNKLNIERVPDLLNPNWFEQPRVLAVHDTILELQKALLDRVFDPIILKRVADNELRYTTASDRFRMSDLFLSVQNNVWAETQATPVFEVNSMRRGLQRAHLNKMLNLLLRDGAAPEDARTMARLALINLRTQLSAAQPRAGSLETKAHVSESIARIDEALKANIQRVAF